MKGGKLWGSGIQLWEYSLHQRPGLWGFLWAGAGNPAPNYRDSAAPADQALEYLRSQFEMIMIWDTPLLNKYDIPVFRMYF